MKIAFAYPSSLPRREAERGPCACQEVRAVLYSRVLGHLYQSNRLAEKSLAGLLRIVLHSLDKEPRVFQLRDDRSRMVEEVEPNSLARAVDSIAQVTLAIEEPGQRALGCHGAPAPGRARAFSISSASM